ncbi:MAG: transposase, partial [Pseudomonadota bacterium]|nr:transposase [Pseudomonadota bacterium]
RCATFTHDYVRNGTTTLFAALSTLEGTVFGRCAPRHRHQEFIAFLDQVEEAVPAGKVIHAVMDNYAPSALPLHRASLAEPLAGSAHKHPEVMAWLADNPRWTFHFTPTSCSWLNAVEGFFSKLTRQALRRGVFQSLDDLVATIDRYIDAANNDPKPFIWTASATSIMAKLKMNRPNESEH